MYTVNLLLRMYLSVNQQLKKLSEEADTLKKKGKYEEAVELYSHAMTMLGKKG